MNKKPVLLAALLVLGLGLPAAGSTFAAMDEKGLLATADAVVRGKVVSVDSFWNDRHTLIITEAVVEVEKAIVGKAPAYVTVRTAGGTVDGFTVEAHGFPTFREGERALLFLQRDEQRPMGNVYTKGRPEGYRVSGYQLGHYRIVPGHRGHELAVPTADLGMLLVQRDGRVAERPRARRLATFEADLRQLGLDLGRVVDEQ